MASRAFFLRGIRLSGRTTSTRGLQFRSSARSFSSITQLSSVNHSLSHISRRHALNILSVRGVSTSSPEVSETLAQQLKEPASVTSTTPVAGVSDTAESLIPAAASATDVVEAAVNSIPPLHYGDLASMGLASYSPAGITRWILEIINVTTHLPWFYTIIAGSLFWKLVTVYPNIVAMRATSRLTPYQDEFAKIQKGLSRAKLQGNRLEIQRLSLKAKNIYEKAGTSIATPAINFIQIPIALGIFFGVRTLCDLPLAQLTNSGVAWIPDLTVADPTYILPAVFTIAANVQLYLSKGTSTAPSAPHILNFMHIVTLLPAYLALHWSSGLVLALTASSVFQSIQSYIFRIPSVRTKLGFLPLVKGKNPSLAESFTWAATSLQSTFKERKVELERQARARRAQSGKTRLR